MTEEFPDYYKLLEVSRNSSQAELKQAYLQQMKFYHPNYFTNRPAQAQEMATRKTQELNKAWEYLGDSERRATYDKLLQAWELEETTSKAKALGLFDSTPVNPTSSPESGKSARSGTDIAELLKIDGFEVADKRKQGGALWVVGGPEHKAYFEEWRAKGYHFIHGSGGRSTKNRPAWWLRPTA